MDTVAPGWTNVRPEEDSQRFTQRSAERRQLFLQLKSLRHQTDLPSITWAFFSDRRYRGNPGGGSEPFRMATLRERRTLPHYRKKGVGHNSTLVPETTENILDSIKCIADTLAT
ncbi:hypothetical protein ACJQWK_03470 [Exserohilum turcicum]